ncbi:MAG: hypothetical protein HON94_04705 [Methylococcales bacterium]|jgi:hypothetical protein|nr:hypothetical protein [Methylococcales bacterium]
MRNTDLQAIDEQLYQWAKWSNQHCYGLGFRKNTNEQRIKSMEFNGAAIKSNRDQSIFLPDSIMKIEHTILSMRNIKQQDVIKIKYLSSGTDQDRVTELAVFWGEPFNISSFRRLLECGLYWLDGCLISNN